MERHRSDAPPTTEEVKDKVRSGTASFEEATNCTLRAFMETIKGMQIRIEILEGRVDGARMERWLEAQAEHDCYELPKCPPRCDYTDDSPPSWFD